MYDHTVAHISNKNKNLLIFLYNALLSFYLSIQVLIAL